MPPAILLRFLWNWVHEVDGHCQWFPTRLDTRVVAAHERINYWEEKCSENVVGLNCSSLEQDGFQARYQYVDLGNIRLTDIVAKQHVVERTPTLVRAKEKDSIFLILLLRGTSFINRASECVVLNEGDCVAYDTNRPYMHGFPGFMQHVIIDVPGEEFRRRFPGWSLKEAVRYDSSIGQ